MAVVDRRFSKNVSAAGDWREARGGQGPLIVLKNNPTQRDRNNTGRGRFFEMTAQNRKKPRASKYEPTTESLPQCGNFSKSAENKRQELRSLRAVKFRKWRWINQTTRLACARDGGTRHS